MANDENYDVPLLACWLHIGAMRTGDVETMRKVIYAAAVAAAETYGDETMADDLVPNDSAGVQHLIARFAAEWDDSVRFEREQREFEAGQ